VSEGGSKNGRLIWKRGIKMNVDYVHGYTERESARLEDQANCLNELLHADSLFPKGSTILEAGCGVGAQTKIIAPKNPDSKFVSIDISPESIVQADALIKSLHIQNVEFQTGDIFDLHFPEESFDHVFVCFVLEHLPQPLDALLKLKKVLKKGGTLTLIEGDHGSTFFYPESTTAQAAINTQVRLQSENGGNANIGRQLYPLLLRSGLKKCCVSPRMVYVDSSKPDFVEGFIKNTFTAMIEGIKEKVDKKDAASFDQGVRDLYRTAQADGVFCYTFFKGIGYNI